MLGIVFVILAGVLWAIDTLIRYPLLFEGISAEKIVFIEHLFLSVIFIPLLLKDAKKIGNLKLSTIFYFIVIGVFGSAIGTLTFTKAFMLINPSLVILLQKLQPIVAISLASVFLGEKVKKQFIGWAIVALIGGLLISSPDIMPGIMKLDFSLGLLSKTALWGYGLALIAVVSWGASTVFGKKLSAQGFDEIQIMGGRFVLGLVFMTFYLFYRFGGLKLDWNLAMYGKVLLMVLLSGLAGMYFYYKGLKMISARTCALAEMFFPFSAVVINWVFLGAKLMPVQIIGAGLLVISSVVIQLKKY
ncbi:MAG: DMT family transporter [Bacteriovorax sp.]|nr:DMT family transporter [Bacteriovorax sp.]